MKKLLAIATIAASLTACGGGNNEATTVGEDSMQKAFDSVQQTGDTSAMNGVMGDTTSASGTHGAGSGSGVGGGKSGGPQKKDGK
ncbi:MAG: hypothetical protein JWR18_1394 [Segetibacter sp.]|jgi:hypothetical protein|nr:hypothetical protein [Segetibacter sp.]